MVAVQWPLPIKRNHNEYRRSNELDQNFSQHPANYSAVQQRFG
jgi:hypothetical protein